ncbi:MAG: L-lactate dehydrogenase [Hespellia sp.]|nr:L-lactate dehydrogenase [Hespellia sp.]
MKKRTIAIIGVGHVGAHCAYSLMMQGLVDELLLVDNNEQKVASECQDLRDAVVYCPNHVDIRIAQYDELKDCDIIVNSVGQISLLETGTRLTELNFTIEQVNDYIPKVMAGGFDGVIVNITNPCDIITRQIALLSGLPKGRVFGTGTGLDTSRLVSALSQQTGLDHKSINAYMMGEHGDQQMVPWSTVSFAGMPLSALEETDARFRFDKEELKKNAINGGWVTYAGKGCTEYGICTTLARDVAIILHDEKRMMPASFELDGEYGEKGLFSGVPCIIGKNGVEQVIELPMTDREKEEFHNCCEGIRHNMTLNDTVL